MSLALITGGSGHVGSNLSRELIDQGYKVRCIDFSDFISSYDQDIVANFFQKIDLVIEKLGIKQSGYRIISNSGVNGGQEVPHFHIHILGGEKIGAKIR